MLHVGFKVDDALRDKLSKVGKDNDIGAIVAVASNEIIQENFFIQSKDLTKSCDAVREHLVKEGLTCAYIVVRVADSQPSLVVYVSDSAKPRDRMVYSSGASNMRDIVRVSSTLTVQASAPEEIKPELFVRKESAAGREDLMTASEKMNDRLSKMEVAPQPSILPGVATPVTKAVDQALDAFAKGEVATVTFKIENGNIDVDKQIKGEKGLNTIVPVLPDDHPRYIITRFTPKALKEEKSVMIYVCPGACPPKEKMPYASSKAPFVAYLSGKKVTLDRRVECGEVSEMIQTVEDHFVDVDFGEEEAAPHPPKPAMAKGPRMLI
ncbi:Cofilin/tropomyosin-type actin-binding protein, putative [Angomonas deanei]|uniref:Cofilin/tropomyosin-type actin-binding protein, putative n=1 Tax=Angomonas deanei TaxID=59799 RepID=A0A7G2CAE2_9TRYP|nr:Cofilin/tropomyosin-type actin-binding protein, putative [Angomonas deanei]